MCASLCLRNNRCQISENNFSYIMGYLHTNWFFPCVNDTFQKLQVTTQILWATIIFFRVRERELSWDLFGTKRIVTAKHGYRQRGFSLYLYEFSGKISHRSKKIFEFPYKNRFPEEYFLSSFWSQWEIYGKMFGTLVTTVSFPGVFSLLFSFPL